MYKSLEQEFDLKVEAYDLASSVAAELASREGDEANIISELKPTVRVQEGYRSKKLFVYLDNLKSCVNSDHEDTLLAVELVDLWLDERFTELGEDEDE